MTRTALHAGQLPRRSKTKSLPESTRAPQSARHAPQYASDADCARPPTPCRVLFVQLQRARLAVGKKWSRELQILFTRIRAPAQLLATLRVRAPTPENHDEQSPIANLINDPVIPHSHPPGIPIHEFLRPRRPRHNHWAHLDRRPQDVVVASALQLVHPSARGELRGNLV